MRATESNNNMDLKKIQEGVRLILEGIGEDISREGLVDTPFRVAEMYQEIFSGLSMSPEEQLKTQFEEPSEGVIILRDIPFVSMCEHHILPITGEVSIGYIAEDKIVGLSKLARVVDVLAKRPQVQERFCSQIADTIYKTLNAKAVGVVVDSSHSCMTIRGVKKTGSSMVTSVFRGEFKENLSARTEFLNMLKR